MRLLVLLAILAAVAEIAPNEQSAMVETRATLGLPGMRMTFRSRDKLIRKRWKTLIARSEDTVWVGPAYQ